MMTDPVADMLARIRNAALARHDATVVPHSKMKEAIAAILKEEGYVSDFSVDSNFPPTLKVTLKYGRDQKSAILGMRRKSRPGRRVYVGYRDIPQVLNGLGIAIVSTSKGMLTDRKAREEKAGGEIVCEVW